MNELTYTEEPPAGPQNAKRKKLFIGLGATVAILGGGYLAYDVLIASRHVETDNAYVLLKDGKVVAHIENFKPSDCVPGRRF